SAYDSTYVSVGGNLIYGNRESALELSNIQHFQAVNNTMTNNSYSVPQNGTVKISGNTGSDYSFYRNIISAGAGAGMQIVNGQAIGVFERNDVYGNNPNYSGYANQTGINSNISSDPYLDSNNFLYCPLSTSPVIFGDYVNNGSNAFMGYIGPCAGTSSPFPTPTPSPTATATPYPTATPSPSPSGNVSQSFTLRMKFAGVTDGSAEGAKVTLRFQNSPNFFDYVTSPITVTHIGNGVYQAMLTFGSSVPPLPANNYYAIYLKGEKHLATKFCQQTGQTTRCAGNGNISIPAATFNPASYVLEFTGLPLEPGDLYPQDGIASSADFTKIKDLLNKPCANLSVNEKLTADLDYNGCVNVRDAFLMRQTLQTRYDEN
ncbi:MAG TPA: hypothetical protein VFI61_04000, partial [Patescibacteria group bacterium]|nr:hypothetical protein [Patescibacteria group bacterium]